MNPISKALDEIKYRIPPQVLNETFKDPIGGWRAPQVSLDEKINSLVLRPRVLVDCNLVGGQTEVIPLDGLEQQQIEPGSVVIHIPKTLTQGRSILSPLSVGYFPMTSLYGAGGLGVGMVSPMTMNDVASAGMRVGDASSGSPPISTSNVRLVSENTILVKDQWRVVTLYTLRCVLMNEENLNNLSVRSYDAFATLCELAVKSYIYNNMYVKLGQAFLQNGQELGEIKTVIESYQDSETMYQTHKKEVMRAVFTMNDHPQHTRWIKLQLSPGV